MAETEQRVLPLNMRSKSGRISGYAAVFDSDSADMGFTERIQKGAFKNALQRSNDVVALFNHDQNQIFGRRGVNLTLREDERGLFMDCAPVATETYANVRENIKSGLVSKQSFSFTVAKDEWADLDSDSPKRTILEIGELFDVGPVVSPCYSETSIATRSLERARAEENITMSETAQERAVRNRITLPDPDDNGGIELTKDEAEKRGFKNFGDQARAIVQAGMPGNRVDPRLYAINARAATGLSESVPSDGGFLVESQFSKEIMKAAVLGNDILQYVHKITINSNGIKIPGVDETSRATGSRNGGMRGYWTAEAGEKIASKPKFRLIELSLNKVILLCYGTDELLQDASALEPFLTEAAGNELGFMLQDAVINGSGAGQPLGILNAGCMVSVTKESGQAADTIVYENVSKMWSRLMGGSRKSAVWVINQDCEPQLHQMTIAVGTGGGGPVYMPANGASGSPYSTLFGRPVVPIEQCQTVGTTGDIMLCDFSKYLLASKGGIQSDVSIHIRYVFDESVFRFVYRVDGQPILSSAITPYSGTSTLSHFVKLDSRD